MSSRRTLAALFLVGAIAHAAPPAPAAPSWPPDAALEVEADQLLFDEPARTAAEAARRQRSVQVLFRWPAASGAVDRYRLLKNGKPLATVDGKHLDHSLVVENAVGRYGVQAGSKSGLWSKPLEAELSAQTVNFALGLAPPADTLSISNGSSSRSDAPPARVSVVIRCDTIAADAECAEARGADLEGARATLGLLCPKGALPAAASVIEEGKACPASDRVATCRIADRELLNRYYASGGRKHTRETAAKDCALLKGRLLP